MKKDYCILIDALGDLTIRKGGVKPGYHEGHFIAALKCIEKEHAVGRKILSKHLGIGETSVRSLIKRLAEKNYVSIDKVAGAILTEKGIKLLEMVNKYMDIYIDEAGIPDLNWPNTIFVILKIPPSDKVTAISIRDKAISVNANAALIAFIVKNRIKVPGLPESNKLYKIIVEKLSLICREHCNTGACIIVYASVRDNEPLNVAGFKLGFEILRHICWRETYC